MSIVGRAHEGRPIFAASDDRAFFVERLGRVFVPASVDLLAWALLINHYHLMIRITERSPEHLFRRLNTAIGIRARRRMGDHGAALQGRYWSRRCEAPGSELAVLTYVLGNPVHHGVVPTAAALETYGWTSYRETLGLAPPRLVVPEKTLALLHPDPTTARVALRDAMAGRVARWQSERAGIDLCEEPGCRGERDGCGLVHPRRARRVSPAGPPTAPATTTAQAVPSCISTVHDELAERRARLRVSGWSPEHLIPVVCARVGADPGALLTGRKRPAEARARALFAHIACDGAGVSGTVVSEVLRVSGATVSDARVRGRALLGQCGWTFDDALTSGERGG